MELILVLLIGILYAAGIYLILRRSMVKLLLGIMLLGNGTNILIFLLGNIIKGKPPIIGPDLKVFTDIYADPIPQALILTAIVISFGLTSFAIVLLKRVYALLGTDDLDDLNTPEEEDI
ncbi:MULTISPECIES: Na+/H+ antiporter subunit C [Sphingobacterium]|jgi:multicomponent Na+:H+ antiporter subunit C|uniref:Na+/H+ antiporter subunit C n=4 Tax=Sphingobacterium TaxID=28453 RepID=A0ACD5BYF2_9SPHI|nr:MULTISPECIES: Na+/H+ antiporter subunit C [Sphingobacterium]APU99255.1 Na+/H+ antiporter subunit C [Sphingobacterium sp. B29]KKO92907.1 monovalent cation/H+ antiporter subunit C [Sphingobacterium sp. Ag1]KKO93343.1 monovalent cation/H+ antiporter subunit C [Sphingobacterium sp. Ag1]MBB1644198.1 cation:proton antiporter [Sphingobacterium sp. UME9]MCS4168294.1 multicomponent Na+:H+ antiporter subunit C [Sphingobacterium sp. BIGb0116]